MSGNNSWHSYPSIFALGHAAVADILTVEVFGEEKIDGSQFSFGVIEGKLRCRSKGQQLNVDAPERMFAAAVSTAKELSALLVPEWTYRAEYLQKPKHNTLAYSRIPSRNLILFDINTGEESYLPPTEKSDEAARIGLEVVPVIFRGMLPGNDPQALIDRESVLGGTKIEGIVLKPSQYGIFGRDKKVLMAKFVSERFKEIHGKEWKKSNPTNGDILLALGQRYAAVGRWEKSVHHLKDAGKLENSPRDIALLIKEVPQDILSDSEEEIKALLFKWAWPHIQRMATKGLPEWYKTKIATEQLQTDWR